MEKLLRNSPTYAVLVALIIQVTRVSEFGNRIGAGWLAWIYAIFLALTIYALSYWVSRLHYEVTATEDEKAKYAQQKRMERLFGRARRNAHVWLILFILIDGGLNLAETMAALPIKVLGWEYAGALVYGVFPTLAALGLGSLQAQIDKIPSGASKASFLSKLGDKLLARVSTGEQVAGKADKQGEQVAGTTSKQGKQVAGKADKQPVQEEALLAYWRDNPQATDKQVADKFGVKRQAIQQRRKTLISKGDIRMTNAGVEIVGTPVGMRKVEA